MAGPIPTRTDESMRRARNRQRLLMLTNSLGEAHASRLARMLRTTPTRVRWMMEGKAPWYRVELSLIHLGLVERVPTSWGLVYRITPAGRRKARSIAASWKRARLGEVS